MRRVNEESLITGIALVYYLAGLSFFNNFLPLEANSCRMDVIFHAFSLSYFIHFVNLCESINKHNGNA